MLQPVWSFGVTKASFKVHTLFLLNQNSCPAAVNKIKIQPMQALQTQCGDHLLEIISIFEKPEGNISQILIADQHSTKTKQAAGRICQYQCYSLKQALVASLEFFLNNGFVFKNLKVQRGKQHSISIQKVICVFKENKDFFYSLGFFPLVRSMCNSLL